MKYYYFAQAYGENNYGACNYQQNATGCTTTGGGAGSTSSSGSGTLTNTGLMLAIIMTAACLLALAAIIVRIWRRQKPDQVPVPQGIEEDQGDEQDSAKRN